MGFGLASRAFFLYAVCAYSQGGVKFPTGGIPIRLGEPASARLQVKDLGRGQQIR